jgi:hypothetical protein
MSWARRGFLFVVGLVASLSLAGAAQGRKGQGGSAPPPEVRGYLDRATAAFALNHYAVAAENYEKAFELKPDPAVLYNAAQAHRLAGNKERALELYQSYLRMYGTEKRAEIEAHIENLKQAIEKDHAVATSPPTTPAPVGGATAEPAAPVKSQPAAATKAVEPAPVLVTQASPPARDDSIVKKPWFWIVVGGVVAAAAVTGFLLTRPGPSDPTASIGPPVNGNGAPN